MTHDLRQRHKINNSFQDDRINGSSTDSEPGEVGAAMSWPYHYFGYKGEVLVSGKEPIMYLH